MDISIKINYYQTVKEKTPKVQKPFVDQYGLHQQIYRHVPAINIKGKVVLDIGCGSGWIEDMLLKKGAKKITGIDISHEVIQEAKKRKLKRVTYRQADATALPFAAKSFDVVVCFEVLEHIPPHHEVKMFKEVNRVLKPGGHFFLSTPHRNFFVMLADPAWWLIKHRHYSVDQIKGFLKSSKLNKEALYVKGGIYTVFLLLSMYFSRASVLKKKDLNLESGVKAMLLQLAISFSKLVTNRGPFMYKTLLAGSRQEFKRSGGIMSLFLHASKNAAHK